MLTVEAIRVHPDPKNDSHDGDGRPPGAGIGRGESGASLVEYALLIALIVMVCIGAMQLLGNDVSTRLSGVGGSLGAGS